MCIRDRPLGARALDRADRGDDRGRAAGEDLGQGAVLRVALPLVDGDAALLRPVTEVTGDGQEGVPGDTLQDGAGEGRGDDLVAVHEVQVHAAEFLDPLALHRVQVADLGTALGRRLRLGEQGRGVVAAGLGVTHAAGHGTDVVLGDPDGHRLHATGEVGAGRGGDDHEQVLAGGLHAQADLRGEHERPQVEGLLAAVRRHPCLVLPHQRVARLDEGLDRQFGHAEPAGGRLEAGGVLLRTEGGDRPVGLTVGLQALEDLLRVVQDHGRRVEGDRRVRHELAVVPAAALGPLDRHHVVGEVAAEPGVGQDRLAVCGGERAGGRLELDRGRRHE